MSGNRCYHHGHGRRASKDHRLRASEAVEAVSDTPHEDVTAARGETQPGAVSGTFSYMSPEQARGGSVDAGSDVFSFAAARVLRLVCALVNPTQRAVRVEPLSVAIVPHALDHNLSYRITPAMDFRKQIDSSNKDASQMSWKKNGAPPLQETVSDHAATSALPRTSSRCW